MAKNASKAKGIGHNSAGAADASVRGPAGFAADQLKSFVERIERLEEEKQTIVDDIRDVYAEAKGTGFDVKVIRQVVRERGQDKAKREEFEAVLDLYRQALGMVVDLPLGRAALDDFERQHA